MILCRDNPVELENIVTVYQELVASNREYLLPVLGSLSALPLPQNLKSDVAQMAADAIGIVKEEDMPTVLNTLLAALNKGTTFQ